MAENRSNLDADHISRALSAEATKAPTVLIVEDNQYAAGVMEEALVTYGGYRVMVASDPLEAIEVVRSTSGDIDVILLDVRLPEANGFQLYDFLKEGETTADIPVILIPAINYREEFARRGIRHVLLKPFAIDELLNCVAEVLVEAA